MIYKLKLRGKDGLEYIPFLDRFKLPDILWGDVRDRATLIWNDFILGEGNCGALLTGASGTGKTLLAEVLCNMAIDNGLDVIFISEIRLDASSVSIIKNLSSLNNVVLLFDEYSKIISGNTEGFLLPMMSSLSSRKLFILTENHTHISEYILNRPGRIKYHFSYPKLDPSIFYDYISHNSHMSRKFYSSLVNLYERCDSFSFDHMQTLVREHYVQPNTDIEEMLNYLNLHGLRKRYRIVLVNSNITNAMNENVDDKFRITSEPLTNSVKNILDISPSAGIMISVQDIETRRYETMFMRISSFKEILPQQYVASGKVYFGNDVYFVNCTFSEMPE